MDFQLLLYTQGFIIAIIFTIAVILWYRINNENPTLYKCRHAINFILMITFILVIKAFRVDIDLSKLGLKRFKIDIYLKNHKLKKPVLNYLKNKPYLEFMNIAIGWADLEPEFVVEKFEELYKIIEDIDSKFPGAIKKQSFFITDKVFKLRCLPEINDF